MKKSDVPVCLTGRLRPQPSPSGAGCGPWTALLICLMLAFGSGTAAAQDGAGEVTAMAAAETVNINAADADTLASRLQGIGMSRAQEIIRYREAYGPFSSVEELADVKGIGQATLDKNRVLITLE
ncbi:ComEA family DNA-binding protein [Kineobactrum salinum]|nr:ComEA family DNA-binding protein [Kineobactrum salinum]